MKVGRDGIETSKFGPKVWKVGGLEHGIGRAFGNIARVSNLDERAHVDGTELEFHFLPRLPADAWVYGGDVSFCPGGTGFDHG